MYIIGELNDYKLHQTKNSPQRLCRFWDIVVLNLELFTNFDFFEHTVLVVPYFETDAIHASDEISAFTQNFEIIRACERI